MEDRSPREITPATQTTNWRPVLRNTAYILLAFLIFLFALDLMLSALQYLGKAAAENIILATSNPFTALFIGLLVTAIIQSSTATTAMTVALVASGSLSLQSAVPIIMGANIGTTITSTIVSLGFLQRKKEFRRAVAAGTYHDFFNILTATLLFPLEYYFQFLSKISHFIATAYFHEPMGIGGAHVTVFTGGLSRVTDWISMTVDNGFILIVLSLALLYGSILFFRKVLTDLLGFGSNDRFQQFFFRHPWKSFAWGFLTTAAIRSSTVTTSLVVPLVAKKVVRLRKAVPFILGANVGTTISAFLAAALNSNAAISIAIAHFLFNFIGLIVFYLIPGLRELPITLASGLGRLTMRYRLAGFLYLLMTFFFIPFSLIYFNRDAVRVRELTYQRTENDNRSFTTVITRTFENPFMSSWTEYPGEQQAGPSRIFSVFHKDNLLIINNELFELNPPGFCRDGEDSVGRFRLCIREVIPKLVLTHDLSADSVFVFDKQYEGDSLVAVRSFISSRSYLLVKREVFDPLGRVKSLEELVNISLK